MANGFIILSDGRGHVRRWTGYDLMLGLVIRGLGERLDEQLFKQFVQGLVPNAEDSEENEAGSFFVRVSDQEMIFRSLDLRTLTWHNQQLFWEALQRSYKNIRLGAVHEGTDLFLAGVRELLRMRRAAARRASPFTNNHWNNGFLQPFYGEKIGPGWEKEA